MEDRERLGHELAGVRPKATITRVWSDGSMEYYWELSSGVVTQMSVYWAGDDERTIVGTTRLPPGPMPELPEP